MQKTISFFILSLLFVFSACEKQVEIEFPEGEQEIVVDGWIEQNKPPIVVLTRSMPYFTRIDSAAFRSLVVSKASVLVETDSMQEFLTLQKDTSFFPPYVYRGLRMRGKVGNTYRLKIIIYDDTLTAETMIPEPPELLNIWSEPSPVEDSVRQLKIKFFDPPRENNYYRIFSRIKGIEGYYYPAYTSALTDMAFDGDTITMPVLKGYTTGASKKDVFYPIGARVELKFCSMNKSSYLLWRELQFEKLNAMNPFAASSRNVQGNIDGGKGIWCGYGASYYQIEM